jgi:hypothetical protein
MKRLVVLMVACLLSVCGCAHQYVMKLSNSQEILTPSKPKLKDGVYYYKDAHGGVHRISQSRVQMIEPAKMAAEEQKPGAINYRPPKNHWWQFWR